MIVEKSGVDAVDSLVRKMGGNLLDVIRSSVEDPYSLYREASSSSSLLWAFCLFLSLSWQHLTRRGLSLVEQGNRIPLRTFLAAEWEWENDSSPSYHHFVRFFFLMVDWRVWRKFFVKREKRKNIWRRVDRLNLFNWSSVHLYSFVFVPLPHSSENSFGERRICTSCYPYEVKGRYRAWGCVISYLSPCQNSSPPIARSRILIVFLVWIRSLQMSCPPQSSVKLMGTDPSFRPISVFLLQFGGWWLLG